MILKYTAHMHTHTHTHAHTLAHKNICTATCTCTCLLPTWLTYLLTPPPRFLNPPRPPMVWVTLDTSCGRMSVDGSFGLEGNNDKYIPVMRACLFLPPIPFDCLLCFALRSPPPPCARGRVCLDLSPPPYVQGFATVMRIETVDHPFLCLLAVSTRGTLQYQDPTNAKSSDVVETSL